MAVNCKLTLRQTECHKLSIDAFRHTSLEEKPSIVGLSLELTASSFIDRNWSRNYKEDSQIQA